MREPNFISPKRSPVFTVSPSRTRQTTRRASTPTTWRNTTVRPSRSTQSSVRSFWAPDSER